MTDEKKGCFDCVIYQEKCNGKKFYRPSDKPSKKCVARVKSIGSPPDPYQDPIQGGAFMFLHNSLRKQRDPVLSPEHCLAQAIGLTSDDAFAKLSAETIQTIKNNL